MARQPRNSSNRHVNGGLDKRDPFATQHLSPLERSIEKMKDFGSHTRLMAGKCGISAATASLRKLWRYTLRALNPRRVFSFPHIMVLVWIVVLLRGERWIFYYKVNHCLWNNWEEWPADAKPHHLVFIADPQLVDPHTYPGRPWPLSSITYKLTDNYLRRGYSQLQSQLQPDSLFFLGDLFDGGREWKTEQGDFKDAPWAMPRPERDVKHAKSWLKNYGEEFWLQEYRRFRDIYLKPYGFDSFAKAAEHDHRIVASLPGNHDLGFGAGVKIPVRDRFQRYFGDSNRIDIVGNHTIVSVDTVSLSAGTSGRSSEENLRPLFEPAREFLDGVKEAKLRAATEELRFINSVTKSKVETRDTEEAAASTSQGTAEKTTVEMASTSQVNDFPTILLTHVPLYRLPGTPCGPMRERWPPAKHPKEENGRIVDPGNAISVSGGYQYQNVLSEEDSVRLIDSIGNVVHVFSGDDHDYCEVVHSDSKNNVHEITVKSINMAMGVPNPGFLMVSLWNPVDATGASQVKSTETNRLATIQTHLCLLPNQMRTYFAYIYLAVLTVVALTIRAFLVPVLHLTPFMMNSDTKGENSAAGSYLPVYKDKVEDSENSLYGGSNRVNGPPASGSVSSYSRSHPARAEAGSSRRARGMSITSGSNINSGNGGTGNGPMSRESSNGDRNKQRWGWAGKEAPRIEINRDKLYGGPQLNSHGSMWRAASARPRITVKFIIKELWASLWRIVWMVSLVFVYLTYKG
ncbi:hypothetical protein Cpir12675_003525 [Ceratocystis pirilliformis]|uniref:Cell division control protein 1 n=1 Tax=Ceratocystis pirilliformis TaxID=259994 RepID=A0ABR3Z5K2_9PEZI